MFSELLRLNKNVNFWRTTNKQEIDFIIEDRYAVEAKLNFQSAKRRTLNFFRKNYNAEIFIVALYGKRGRYGKYPWEIMKVLESKPFKR